MIAFSVSSAPERAQLGAPPLFRALELTGLLRSGPFSRELPDSAGRHQRRRDNLSSGTPASDDCYRTATPDHLCVAAGRNERASPCDHPIIGDGGGRQLRSPPCAAWVGSARACWRRLSAGMKSSRQGVPRWRLLGDDRTRSEKASSRRCAMREIGKALGDDPARYDTAGASINRLT